MHRRQFLGQTTAAAAWLFGCRANEHGDGPPADAESNDSLVPAEPPLEPTTIEAEPLPEPPPPAPEPEQTVSMFRGNPSHTFYGTGPISEQPQLAWRTRLGEARGTRADGSLYHWQGTGWTGQPVLSGQRVFVGALDGRLYCFNTRTGEVIWQHQTGGMIKGSCCLYAGHLYVGNVDNWIRCIDARDGALVWKHYNPRDCDSSPCVADDNLYIGGEDGQLKCFDPRTGELVWALALGQGKDAPAGSGGIESSPAVADGEVFVGHYDGFLLCADAKTGAEKWRARQHDVLSGRSQRSGSMDLRYRRADLELTLRRGWQSALWLPRSELLYVGCGKWRLDLALRDGSTDALHCLYRGWSDLRRVRKRVVSLLRLTGPSSKPSLARWCTSGEKASPRGAFSRSRERF